MNKKIFILLFFLFVLISMSAVSAVDADDNNDTIVSSADAEALAIENDVNAIDDLSENVADGGDEAIADDSASVAVGKNNGNDLLSADNDENGNILTAAPKTYYVNASAASGGTGTETAPFQTLNAALDKAENGDTIMIAAGEYKGTDNTGLQIWSNLNFIKYGDGEAIFDAEGQSRVWTVMDDSINIIGLTFKNGINREGGAIYMSGGNVTNCTFTGNNATGDSTSAGGAIYCLFYTNVTNCNFTGNTAQYRGGAIYFMRGGNVSDCTFTGNTANWWGGAIRLETVDNTKGTVTNCAFVNNSAQNGKVISSSGVLESIDNNWWGSNDPDWNELINKGGIPSSYAVLNGSADSETIKPGYNAKLNYTFYMNGTANVLSIPSRPIELSATGGHLDDDTGYLVNGKFSTEFSSDALGEFEITATVDNQEVKLTETVAATVWYVNATAAPGGDGKSQATPFQTLKEALIAAEDGDTIMIASGTYTGENNTDLTIDKKLSFEKYGDGEAILDAQQQNGIFTVNAATININGLTFKNGKRTGNTITGGAIYFGNALSDSIINATFIDNTVVGGNNLGGAIYFDNKVDNVKIFGEFINNTADLTQNSYGGAIAFHDAVSNSIINATFIDNSANWYGGAVYSENTVSNVEIYGEFKNNKVTRQTSYGGAIALRNAVSNSIINATFIDNNATGYAGAISFTRDYNIENFKLYGKFINNRAGYYGGAIYSSNSISNSIINATFINNTAEDGGANMLMKTLTNVNITGDFINNTATGNDRESGGGANYFNQVLTNVIMSGNFIGNSADPASDGGGVNYFYKNVYNLYLTGNFTNNKASNGANFFLKGVYNSIIDAAFINNTASGIGVALCFNDTLENTDITGKFINNTGDSVIHIKSAETYDDSIHDSIFINNNASKIINIGSGEVKAFYNWFGNNATNCDQTPADVGITLENWLFLNAIADPSKILVGESSAITFELFSYNGGVASPYDASKMNIELKLTQTLGELDKDTALIGEEISYTAKDGGDASVTATFETASYTISLKNKLPATIYVNASVDSSGNGSESAPFKTLKEALDVAEDYDTIMIAAGEYTGTNNRGLSIRNNISLEKYGEGEAIFDAEKSWRILNVYAGTINITGLTFKNGRSTYGGAIYFDNPVSNSNINAVFINNTADQGGAILFGGAFSNSIINATFINNSASREGGANYFASLSNVIIIGDFINNTLSKGSAGAGAYGGANYFNGYVENSNISGTYNHNTADRGGANYFNGYVENSNIDGAYTNNVATVHGGASYFKNPVTNSNISGTYNHNTAETGSGGANSISTVTNSNISGTYTNNVANDNGGANSISLTVTYSNITGTYINNTAGKKSIIYIDAYSTAPTNVIISNAVFLNNNYDKTYGVIYAGKTGVTANDNWFGNNATDYDVEPKTTDVRMDNWLFLNATADPSELDIGENSTIIFRLYDKNSPDVAYDASKMNIKLTLEQTLGELDKTSALLGEEITYTAKNEGDASVTATFETASYTVDLINIKPKTPTSINLTNETMNLKVGDETPAGATLDPAVGDLNYTSSNESVVIVENGIIRAVGDGTANVTVSFNGTDEYAASERNISVSVSLNEAVWYYILQDVRRELDGASLLLPFGVYNCLVVNSTGQPLPKGLNVTIKLDDAYTINSTVGDDGIFEVDVNGITPQFYTVTFSTYGYTSAVATVLIVKKPTSIALENETMALKVNDEIATGATLTPADAGNLTYTSSNSSVAIVENGKIKAIGEGSATITVSFAGNNVYDAAENKTITVTVALRDASVTVYDDSMDLFIGGEGAIDAYTTPEGLNVNFKSNNESVVTVDAKGKVTAVGLGNTTITVSVGGDGVYALNSTTVTVNVGKITTEILIANETLDLKVLENVSAGATLIPDAGDLTYASSNETVAVVQDGIIKALKEGNATITVSFKGNETHAASEANINVTVKKIDTSINVTNTTVDMLVGDEAVIGAALIPAGAGELDFTSSDVSVVKVNGIGELTAVGEGTATITVSFIGNDKYAASEANVTVTVSLKDASVSVENSTLNLKFNDTFDIVATTVPEGLTVNYASSNETVATVDAKGKIVAVGTGRAVITVSVGGDGVYALNSTNVTVTVSRIPTEIIVAKDTLELYVLKNFTAGATLTPADAGNLTYTSSNSSVAVVEDGEIKALAKGTAIITVSFVGDDKYATAENKTISVSVGLNPARVNVNNSTLDLKVDENFNLVATTDPSGLNVTYVSDNSDVVSVDDNGVVNALKEGNATIIVKVGDGKKYAENSTKVLVSVSKIATEIKIDSATGEMSVGAMGHISAELTPFVAGNLTYASNDAAVVNVSSTGVIRANKAGTALITVSFAGDDKYAAAENKTIAITVNLNPASVTVNNSTLDLKVKDNFTLVATTVPAGLDVTYVPGNSSVVSVDDKGFVTALSEGTTIVTVKVGGDGVYAENSTIVMVNVTRISPLPGDNKTIPVNNSNTTNTKAPVYTIDLPDDATGNFTVIIDKKPYKTVEVVNGKAEITVPGLTPGDHEVTLEYSGDIKYAPIVENTTSTVVADPVVIPQSSSVVQYTGKYSVVVKGKDGKVASGVKVAFYISGKYMTTVKTDKNGIASFDIPNVIRPAKKFVIRATSAFGVSALKKVSYKHIVYLKAVKVKKSAKKLVLTAAFKKVNGKYYVGKKVTFVIAGYKFTGKINKNGVAQVVVGKKVLNKLQVGKVVKYSATFLKDTVKRSAKVKK